SLCSSLIYHAAAPHPLSILSLHDALPISIIDVRPSGVSVSSDRAIEPVAANGIETRRISGCSSDLKVATMMTNTMRIAATGSIRSEEHTSELQSRFDLVCRPLLEIKQINE